MQISGIQNQASTYSLRQSNELSEEAMKTLIDASAQIEQAPMKQKMVNNVNNANNAVQNGHVDIYA